MARLRVAPTRSNLLRLRQTLKFAREGYEVLDRKREVLTTELLRVAHDAAILQEKVWAELADAYRAYLEWAALSVKETIAIDIRLHSVMGVVLPLVEAHGAPPETPYGLGDTTVSLDEAAARFRRVLSEIPTLTETMTTVWRLARELQKTQRRVNALQYIFIPQYEETVAFIESTLEEREREETFRLKRLKSKGTEVTAGPARHEYEQPYRDISGGKSPIYRDLGGGKPSSRQFG